MTLKRATPLQRAALTDDELRNLKVEEYIRLRLTEDESARLREINRLRAVQREERVAQLRAEQRPLLRDLEQIGFTLDSVWDLVNSPDDYSEAIPTLLEHLTRPYADTNRGGIARALAVPDAACAWDMLVGEYEKLPAPREDQGLGAKNGLAVALSAASSDAVLDKLIELIKDRTHGSSRNLLLRGLRKSKSSLAKETLEQLQDDDQLAADIRAWQSKAKRRSHK